MEDRLGSRPWQPKPFSIAVLDSDEYLGDVLCDLLRDSGFAAAGFYDIASLMLAHQATMFDAYVLDYLADWPPQSNALENLVASIRGGTSGDVPIYILGNQVEPERIERLGNIIMQHKVRYVLRPLSAPCLAKRVGEALAKRVGL
jgi:DNA-binding response OmpR family regulator